MLLCCSSYKVYALCFVAIYGRPILESARRTNAMVRASGLDMVINDSIALRVLFLGAAIGGIAAGILSGLWAKAWLISQVSDASDPEVQWGIAFVCVFIVLICAIVGVVVISHGLRPVRSAIATLFVCWADDPDAIKRARPDLYAPLLEAAKKRYPGLNPRFT